MLYAVFGADPSNTLWLIANCTEQAVGKIVSLFGDRVLGRDYGVKEFANRLIEDKISDGVKGFAFRALVG
ncbi:MAG: hypothetical protein DLM68_06690 [Hyphomicrobiales bacterium]|nr:MAG: hypothetical protein DLM68_06690 [Hyphomicrobiales bacterium]